MRRFSFVIGSLSLVLVGVAGCSSASSQESSGLSNTSSQVSSGLSSDCSLYQPLSRQFRQYKKVTDEYAAEFPFLASSKFQEKLYVYDYGTSWESDIESERAYLMGTGKLPDSMKSDFGVKEPFTSEELRFLAERPAWDAKLAGVKANSGTQFSEVANLIWPKVADPDLKDLLRFIADNNWFGENQIQIRNDFLAADSKCGF
jgi:hypothetical protein